jgi:hypothetical protein
MVTNYIITEDKADGFAFFNTLAHFGIFKNTAVISAKGFTGVPYAFTKCVSKSAKDLNWII